MEFSEVICLEQSPLYPNKIYQIALDSSARTLQDVKFPEKAGAFTYNPKFSKNLKNRFIIWRSHANGLELQEESLDCTLHNSFIKFAFSDTSVVNCSIFDTPNDVEVLVCTAFSVARFTFHHPNQLRKMPSPNSEYSIFHDGDTLCKSVFMVRGLQPTQIRCASACLRSTDQHALYAFGLTTGSLVVVDMPYKGSSENTLSFELHKPSVMQKIWSGIVPFSSKPDAIANDTPTDLCFVDADSALYLLAICRDHKLRLWNVNTHDCLAAVDLLEYLPDQMSSQEAVMTGGQGHRLRRPERVKGSQVPLVCLLNLVGRTSWVHLKLDLGKAKTRPRDCLTPLECLPAVGEDAVDFVLLDSREGLGVCSLRYVLEESGGMYAVQWRGVEDQELCREVALVEAGKRTALPEVQSHEDIEEVVLQELFTPGRFARVAIVNAIKSFRRSTNMPDALECGETMLDLKEEVIKLLEKKVSAIMADELYDEGEAECLDPRFVRVTQWEKFFAAVCDYQELALRPTALFSLSGGGLGIIRRAVFSLVRPLQAAEQLVRTWSDATRPRDVAFTMGRMVLESLIADDRLRQDLFLLMPVCVGVTQFLDTSHLSQGLLFRMTAMGEDPLHLVREVVQGPRKLSDAEAAEIMHSLGHTQDIYAAMNYLLDLLERVDIPPEEADDENGQLFHFGQPNVEQSRRLSVFSSPMAAELLRQGVLQNTQTRLRLAVAMLFINELLIQKAPWLAHLTVTVDALVSSIGVRLVSLIRTLLVILWTAETRPGPLMSNTATASSLHSLTLLGMCVDPATLSADSSPQKAADRTLATSSLLEQLYASQAGLHVGAQGGCVWALDGGRAVSHLQGAVCPSAGTAAVLTVCRHLLTHGKCVDLLTYTRLLTGAQPKGWWPGDELLIELCVGLALVFLGESAQAVSHMSRAAEELGSLASPSETLLLDLINEDAELQLNGMTLTQIQGQVFLKVMRVVESFECPVQVVDLAHRALAVLQSTGEVGEQWSDPDGPGSEGELIAVLWTRIFKHELAMGRNCKAYEAILANPDAARRRDCLRQLVIVLCDRGELQSLVEFNYGELEEELVSIIESRARGVDLSSYNYYDLLYAFHVTRGNYRRAALAMHELAVRAGQEATLTGRNVMTAGLRDRDRGAASLRALQLQARSYLAALNVMRLVRTENRWIVKPRAEPEENNESFTTYRGGKRPRHSGEERGAGDAPRLEVVEMKDMEREYQLIRARLRVAQIAWDQGLIHAGPISAPETVHSLLATGLYQEAVRLSQTFDLSLDPVLSVVTSRCVELGATRDQGLRPGERNMLLESLQEADPNASHEGLSVVDLYWRLLQALLARLEGVSGELHRGVISKLLGAGRTLPTWLSAGLERRSSGSLLRLYLSHDALESATQLACRLLNTAVKGSMPKEMGMQTNLAKIAASIENTKGASVLLPHTTIARLMNALQFLSRDHPVCQEMHSRLVTKVSQYYEKLVQVSQDEVRPPPMYID